MIEKADTNHNAKTALTFGILALVIPFIGLILGIIGIVFSRKSKKEIELHHQEGSGLATSGMICSVIGIIMQLYMILAILAYVLATGA